MILKKIVFRLALWNSKKLPILSFLQPPLHPKKLDPSNLEADINKVQAKPTTNVLRNVHENPDRKVWYLLTQTKDTLKKCYITKMKKKTKTLLLISIQCECDKLVKYVKFEAENNIYSMKYFVTLFFALHFLSSFFWQQQVFWVRFGNCFHPRHRGLKIPKKCHIWIFIQKVVKWDFF